MNGHRARVLLVVVLAIGASAVAFAVSRTSEPTAASGAQPARGFASLPKEAARPLAPELVHPQGFINTPAVTMRELRGKVVLVDFWTFECVNCQRTLPYVRAWYERYRKDGLVVLGVHSPEFDHERDPANVADAVRSQRVTWPVVLDPDHATWSAFHNEYWPAQYLVDRHGRIATMHIGEGAYDDLEHAIVALLAEP